MKLKDLMTINENIDIQQIEYELEKEVYGDLAKSANSLEYANMSFDYHQKNGNMKYMSPKLKTECLSKIKEQEKYISTLKKKFNKM